MIIPTACSFFARFPPFWRNLGAQAPRQHVFFTHQRVAERGQQVQSTSTFSQAERADHALAKDLLYVPERMLHFGPGPDFELLGSLLMLFPLLNPKITVITEHVLFVPWRRLPAGIMS